MNAIRQESGRTALSAPRADRGSRWKKRIGVLLFVLLNAAVLWLTASAEFSRERQAYRGEPFSPQRLLALAGAAGCVAFVLAAETGKLLLMMRRLGERVSLRAALETAALGRYYDCVTPSGAGGQPFQIWYLRAGGYSAGAAAAMPLLGFFTRQTGLVILTLGVFALGRGAVDSAGIRVAAYFGAAGYTVVPAAIALSAAAPRLAARLADLGVRAGARLRLVKDPDRARRKAFRAVIGCSGCFQKLARDRRTLAGQILISLAFQVASASLPFFAIRAFGGGVGYGQALAMCVFLNAAISLVPTPGNAGAAEGSFYLLFSGPETAGAFWAMLVWRLFAYYSFVLIGLLIFGGKAVRRLFRGREAR